MEDLQLSLFDIQEQVKGIKKYVRRISYSECLPFLLNIHYARKVPCITDAFGLFEDCDLIGVVTFGVPASMPLCRGIAGDKNRYNVLELNRLCLLPNRGGV